MLTYINIQNYLLSFTFVNCQFPMVSILRQETNAGYWFLPKSVLEMNETSYIKMKKNLEK